MIIGKKDKERFKQLQKTNDILNDEYFQRIYKDDLLQVIKAIINKFGSKEIVITHQEIKEAEGIEMFIEEDCIHRAKKYKVINPIQLLHSFKEEHK